MDINALVNNYNQIDKEITGFAYIKRTGREFSEQEISRINELENRRTEIENQFKEFEEGLKKEEAIKIKAREYQESVNPLSKAVYSAMPPVDIDYWKKHYIAAPLQTAALPFVLSGNGLSSMLSGLIPERMNPKTGQRVKEDLWQRASDIAQGKEMTSQIIAEEGRIIPAIGAGILEEVPALLLPFPAGKVFKGGLKIAGPVVRPTAKLLAKALETKIGQKATQITTYPLERPFMDIYKGLARELPGTSLAKFQAEGRFFNEGLKQVAAEKVEKIGQKINNVLAEAKPGAIPKAEGLMRQQKLVQEKLLGDITEEAARKTEATLPHTVRFIGRVSPERQSIMVTRAIEEAIPYTYTKGILGETFRTVDEKASETKISELSYIRNFVKKADRDKLTIRIEQLNDDIYTARLNKMNESILKQAAPELAEKGIKFTDLPKYKQDNILLVKDFITRFNLTRGAEANRPLFKGFSQKELTRGEFESIGKYSDEVVDESIYKKILKAAKGVKEGITSPYYIAPREIWDSMNYSGHTTQSFVDKSFADFKTKFGFDLEDLRGKYKASGEKVSEAVEFMRKYRLGRDIDDFTKKQLKMSDREVELYNYFQEKFSHYRDLVNRVYPGTLPETLDIPAYMHRLTSSPRVMQGIRDEIADIMSKKKNGLLEGMTLKEANKRLKDLISIQKNWEKNGTIIYSQIPKSVRASFLEHQKLIDPLFKTNIADSYIYYVSNVGRKMFIEPALKNIANILPTIKDIGKRKYTAKLVQDWLGLNDDKMMEEISRGLVAVTNYFALTSPSQFFTNATQILNPMVDVGVAYTTKATLNTLGNTPKFQKAWLKSQYYDDVEGIIKRIGGKIGRTPEEKLIYPIQLAEPGLRKSSYYAGYLEAEEAFTKGFNTPAGKFVRNLTEKGYSAEDAFAAWGDGKLIKNQFVYGVLGLSKLQRGALGRPIFLYTSFATKEIEIIANWIKHNPQKLIAYLALTYGTERFAKYIGFDIINILGTGLDYGKLSDAYYAMNKASKEPDLLKKLQIEQEVKSMLGESAAGGGMFPAGLVAPVGIFSQMIQNKTFAPTVSRNLKDTMYALSEGESSKFVMSNISEDIKEGKLPALEKKYGFSWRSIPIGYPFRQKFMNKTEMEKAINKGAPLKYVLTPKELAIKSIGMRPAFLQEQAKENIVDRVRVENQKKYLELYKNKLRNFQDNDAYRNQLMILGYNYIYFGGAETGLNNAIKDVIIDSAISPEVAKLLQKQSIVQKNWLNKIRRNKLLTK